MKNILICLILLTLSANADLRRDNSKEIVSDTSSKLMWQDNSEAKIVYKNWNDAIEYCESLLFSGYNDWRLPNINELLSIADRTKYNPAINSVFSNVNSSDYWSSTTYASGTSNAWVVNFYYGNVDWLSKTYSYYVRCVRDGQ